MAKIEKRKKPEEIKPPKPSRKGGKRRGSGRKKSIITLMQEQVEKHGLQQIDASVVGKDGKQTGKIVKKARVLLIMDKLFAAATAQEMNTEAAKEYLKRILGVPAQPLKMPPGKPGEGGEKEDKQISVQITVVD